MIKIFEYLYNTKKYIAYIYNGKIYFGINNNGNITNDMAKDEYFIINTIYNFIVGDKKYIIELSNTKFENKVFRTFYNTQNRLYSFLEINNNEEIHTDSDNTTLAKLNYIFNNQSEFLYKNSYKDILSKTFNILVKINTAIITVAVSGSMILSTLPSVPSNELVFKADYLADSLHMDSDKPESNKNFKIENMLSTIHNNQNLSEKEKEIIIKIQTEVKENIDFMDEQQLLTNLSELKLHYFPYYDEYNEELNITPTHEYPFSGCYIFAGEYKNQINLMGNEEYNTDSIYNSNEATLFHELNHLMNKRQYLLSMNNKSGTYVNDLLISLNLKECQLEEMVNELFTREYLNTFSNQENSEGYPWLMPVAYALCEIIDSDTLKKYKFDSDPYYITHYLNNLGLSLTETYDLYKSLALVSELSEQIEINYDIKSLRNYEYNNSKIYNTIKKCYELKYNKPMENDLIMLSYFYKSEYVDENFDKRFENLIGHDSLITQITPKGYFSEDFKREHPSVTIEYIKDLEISIMEINDENRYIQPKEFDRER